MESGVDKVCDEYFASEVVVNNTYDFDLTDFFFNSGFTTLLVLPATLPSCADHLFYVALLADYIPNLYFWNASAKSKSTNSQYLYPWFSASYPWMPLLSSTLP